MQSQGVVSMEPRTPGQVNSYRTKKLNESSKKQMSQTVSTRASGRRVASARNDSHVISAGGRNEAQTLTITTTGTDAKKYGSLLHRKEGE